MEIPTSPRDMVLIEDGDQLRAVLALSDPHPETTVMVALTPAADYAADRAGVPYLPIDALYSESELLRLGDENGTRVEAFCHRIDQFIDQHRSEDASPLAGFSAHDLFFRLRVLFDAVLRRSFCLESAVQKLKPQRITYFRARSDQVQDDLLFRDRTLTSAVIPQLAERLGIAIRQLDAPPAGSARTAGMPQWRSLISRTRDGVSHVWWRALDLGRHHGGPTLIPLSEGYDLGPIIREWQRRRLALMPFRVLRWKLENPFRRRDARVARLGQRLFDQLERDAQFSGLFAFGSVQALDVMRSRLKRLCLQVLPHLAVLVQRARRLLEEVSEGLVVGTPAIALSQLGVLVAARSRGMPIALHQHGGGYGLLALPMVERHDLALADYFLCYGPNVAEFYSPGSARDARALARPRASLVPVGSSALDELRRRGPAGNVGVQSGAGTRTVVYVVSNFSEDTGYFDYRTYPDLAYWRLQKGVVLRCAQRNNIRLVIKLHPNDGRSHPMSALIRDRGFSNCRVLVDTPFTDLLGLADLFIIDYPSSTSLLQALTTERKILALADEEYTRPDPRAVEMLRRRIVLETSRDEFLRRIDATLDEPDWTLAQPIDYGVLHSYGTGPDGNAASRAVDALIGIQANRGSHVADLQFHEVTTV